MDISRYNQARRKQKTINKRTAINTGTKPFENAAEPGGKRDGKNAKNKNDGKPIKL